MTLISLKGKSGKLTAVRRAIILESLEEYPHMRQACARAGMSVHHFQKHKNMNPQFKAEVEAAMAKGYECLEAELTRRAMNGVLVPVFQKGHLVGHKREYSDALGMFLLKGHMKKRYADRTELTGADGGKVEFVVENRGDGSS